MNVFERESPRLNYVHLALLRRSLPNAMQITLRREASIRLVAATRPRSESIGVAGSHIGDPAKKIIG